MPTNRPKPGSSSARNEQIAALHIKHTRELQRRVARRARADPPTIEDACAFAWLQLLTHPSVDLASPEWGLLGWLTQTATREARRLQRRRVRDGLLDPLAIESEPRLRGPSGVTADEFADQHARIDLVAQASAAAAPLSPAPGARLQLPRDRRVILSGACRRWSGVEPARR